ncbi:MULTISPECIES: ATP-grasp fold amidoligase family protein [Croceitalea]|uniref:ATP-grasp fold amidoligase family protein n=1 Tax=Croceitalea vernalis TaxID=3075599 RepID=A0ABU3BIZ9_9FLAO|nr:MULTISPECIES: ATP-grasp fold amidoligase family protein [unclassified Croceitalea]MDT0540298.1 ATP-grasp fold amidoligase family protein [Croceitalea sp. P059]MDT0622133.1 ATP-grasp fold amidoligase family protein [Croceitalea sp. P007]
MLKKLGLGILKKMKFLSPDLYVKIYYEYYTGKKLNLENPIEFNEKIQWLKVYYQPEILTKLVDKFAVREYVERKIGKEYLNRVLAITTKADGIKFEELPSKFVVKATHGCNFNLIITNKEKINKVKSRLLFKKWLSRNQYYRGGLEWAYKNVPPRLLVEEFMDEPGKSVLDDFKFYCFNGTPNMVQVDIGRGTEHKRVFMDLEWQKLPIRKGNIPLFENNLGKPKAFKKMIELARILASDFPFVRVDFYYVNNKIYFGEMTFYPGDGRQEFKPNEYNKIIGEHLKLPKIPKGQKYITEV